jgi:secondary thiamine-phosphate synthase enzyme
MARLVPDGDRLFAHADEGPDDMPAHIRAILTQVELTLPISGGACALGTWQGLYLYEHRTRGQRRRITLTIQGE